MIWLNSLQIRSTIIPQKRTQNLTLCSSSLADTKAGIWELEGRGDAVMEGKGKSTNSHTL